MQLRLPRVPENFWVAPVSLGDVHPVEYGGGYLFRKNDRAWVEWTHGPDEGVRTLTVFVFDVPEDVFAYHDWAKPSAIASTYGTTAHELRAMGRSLTTAERAEALLTIGGHYGFDNLDSYPVQLTARELERRWRRARAVARTPSAHRVARRPARRTTSRRASR